ncbi:hypothetical protein pipiens_009534 [Culex pipiens pipiens]|uniref:Uncharacterized protein n=1 Tax=Culex pipiens pipiens TaxID=38569 RepID=A0ABD1DDW0_CULPP
MDLLGLNCCVIRSSSKSDGYRAHEWAQFFSVVLVRFPYLAARFRSRVVANQVETLTLQVATGIIRSRATTPTDNPALLDSTKGSKFRGEPPSSSSVNTRAGRRPSTHAAVEPSTTNRPNRDGLVEA